MKHLIQRIVTVVFIPLFILLLQLNTTNLLAQEKNNIEDEILVYFLPDSLEMPEMRIKSTDKSKLKIKSKKLSKIFQKLEFESISKAFPDFKTKDMLKFNKEGKKIKLPNMSRIFKLKLKKKYDIEEVIKTLSNERSVLFAERNGGAEHLATQPNDTYFTTNQWNLHNTGQTGGKIDADIDAPEAWDIYKGSANNIIAIIDGGIDKTHPDLSGKVTGDNGYGWDGHGTHVAGIAAANTNNQKGIAGVDWYAKLHAKRIDGTDDVGKYNALVNAVNYNSHVYVLNNSWRLINPVGRFSTTVRLAFSYAYKMNRTSVVAMGNDGNSTIQYPAGFGQGIIAVGATDHFDKLTSFSSYGNHIDVSAPGANIRSTYLNNGYDELSGTSMAAPHVSGIASLLKGYNTSLANDDIGNIIKISADKVDGMNGNNFTTEYGYGRVNARKALEHLRSPYILFHRTATGGTVYGSPSEKFGSQIYGAPGLADGYYQFERYNVRKTIQFFPHFRKAYVWGRGAQTTGWANDPKFAMPWCDVVPGSIQGNTATLETYCYKVYDWASDGTITGITWEFIGWYPCQPSQVEYAFTTHGENIGWLFKENFDNNETLLPTDTRLKNNYPNPFNPSTTIKYQLSEPGFVSLKVYDMLGREVANLVNEQKGVGFYETKFDASKLTSGIYFYTIRMNDYTASKKMLLTK